MSGKTSATELQQLMWSMTKQPRRPALNGSSIHDPAGTHIYAYLNAAAVPHFIRSYLLRLRQLAVWQVLSPLLRDVAGQGDLPHVQVTNFGLGHVLQDLQGPTGMQHCTCDRQRFSAVAGWPGTSSTTAGNVPNAALQAE